MDHAVDPFEDPIDDVKWVLQRDMIEVAGPVLSRMVESDRRDPRRTWRGPCSSTDSQVRELHTAGMTVGGHTHGHRWMDHIPREDSVREIAASVAQLTALGPTRGWPFAYPYGSPPPDPAALLRPAGFPAAFLATGSGRSDRYRLGRIDAETLGPRPTSHRQPSIGSAT